MSKISKGVVVVDQSDSDLSLQLSDASSLSSDSDLSDSQQTQQKKQQLARKKKQIKKKAATSSSKKSSSGSISANKKKTMTPVAKKKVSATTNKKKSSNDDDTLYCICRKGYDGKEFMIECDGCQEWFHGACVGVKPNSILDHYFCKTCLSAQKRPAATALQQSAGKTLIPPPPISSVQVSTSTVTEPPRKKSILILPITKPSEQPKEPAPTSQPAQATLPAISKLSIDQDDDEGEDLDDICVLCDGDCTCSAVEDDIPVRSVTPPPPPQPAPKIDIPKVIIKKSIPQPAAAAAPTSQKSKISKKPKKSTPPIINHDISSISGSSSESDSDSGNDSSSSESDSKEEVVLANKTKTKKKPKKNMPPAAPFRRGKSTTLLANIIRQKAPPPFASKGQPKKGSRKGQGKKTAAAIAKANAALKQEEEDDSDINVEDEEVIVDDLDDLLETMSPLSEHSDDNSDESLLLESEEFFTDDDDDDSQEEDEEDKVDVDSSSVTMSPYPDSSDVYLDSGDDEDIENAETQAIIAEMTLDSDEDISDSDSGMFIEDEDEEEEEEEQLAALSYYINTNNHWSTDDEDEEEEEFDYNTTALPTDEDEDMDSYDDDEEEDINPLLPLLDSEGNLYDSIAAAFMQALAPLSEQQQDESTVGTPSIGESIGGEGYQLSAFELAHALNALSTSVNTTGQQQEFLRRPSLPSSAVSAAQRHRGSIDFTTSEALRALSALVTDDLSLVHALEPIHEDVEAAETADDNTPTTMLTVPPLTVTTPSSLPPPPPTLPSTTTTTTTTETTTTDSNILPNQLALFLSTDLKLQEQILDILKGTLTAANQDNKLPLHNTTSTASNINKKASPSLISSRQILPKPSGSGIGSSSSSSSFFSPSPTTTSPTLEQQIQDAINLTLENSKKRAGLNHIDTHNKKRRLSRSNSLDTVNHHLQAMASTSFSTPASPAAIIDELEDMKHQKEDEEEEEAMAVSIDDLVDTSQLYSRSLSPDKEGEKEEEGEKDDEDNPYSRDLSRWQRIPIGAFRLMRSKNKLWLER